MEVTSSAPNSAHANRPVTCGGRNQLAVKALHGTGAPIMEQAPAVGKIFKACIAMVRRCNSCTCSTTLRRCPSTLPEQNTRPHTLPTDRVCSSRISATQRALPQ
eukprot:6813361-Prorocentrum_lima.AAC.1